MNHTEHAISRVEFETILERRERVRSVQDRISRFANRVLDDVLTEGLARFDGSPRTLEFRRVELDLGEISLEHLERELEEKMSRHLRVTKANRHSGSCRRKWAGMTWTFVANS